MAAEPEATMTITTRVGHAGWGDNRFRGYSVREQLAGRESFLGAVVLGLIGRRLTADEAALVDHLTSCSLVADPRIWPLKVVRLVSSYGQPMTGLAASLLIAHGSDKSPWISGECAAFLAALDQQLGAATPADHDAIIRRYIENHAGEPGSSIPGWGTQVRARDERVAALLEVLGELPRWHQAHFVRLVRSIERVMLAAGGPTASIHPMIAALGLELGLTPEAISVLACVLFLPNCVANAFESACEPATALQRLPDHAVEYVGPPSRTSPRARVGGE